MYMMMTLTAHIYIKHATTCDVGYTIHLCIRHIGEPCVLSSNVISLSSSMSVHLSSNTDKLAKDRYKEISLINGVHPFGGGE